MLSNRESYHCRVDIISTNSIISVVKKKKKKLRGKPFKKHQSSTSIRRIGDLSNDKKFNILGWWKLGSRQDRSQCEPRELAIWHGRPPWGSVCGGHGHL